MPINDNVLGNLINNFTIPVLRSKTSEVEVLFFASRDTRGLVLKKKKKKKNRERRNCSTIRSRKFNSSVAYSRINYW